METITLEVDIFKDGKVVFETINLVLPCYGTHTATIETSLDLKSLISAAQEIEREVLAVD